jgi:inward rectifier potassium channel
MRILKRSPSKRKHKGRVLIKVENGIFSIEGLGSWQSYWREPYHLMLTIPWLGFIAIVTLIFLFLNAFFACLYLLGGDNIVNARPGSFEDAFFFSVQTIASIGYGVMSPKNTYANLIIVLESIAGLFVTAVTTGLIFSRFSRPTAKVIFSEALVIMPYEGIPTLIFRAANQRRNRILEAEVIVYLSRDEMSLEGHHMRRFYQLKLSRSRTPTFNLPWTLMHQIDQSSPLHGYSRSEMVESHTQLIVSLTGLDETVSQTVHARHTYGMNQVYLNHQLADIIHFPNEGDRYIDFAHFHQVIPLESE